MLHRRIIGKEMPDDWKGNRVTNFHLQWEDKDGDRLPIEKRQDLIIASQEMMRTVLTPTIFVNPKPNRRPTEPGAGGNDDYDEW